MSLSLDYIPFAKIDDIPGGISYLHDGLQSLYASSVGATVCSRCHKILTLQDMSISIPENQDLSFKTLRRILVPHDFESGDAEDEVDSLPNFKHYGCGGNLSWLYGGIDYRKKIEKIVNVKKIFGVMLQKGDGNFCGMAFGYLGTLEDGYINDYSYHFGAVGIDAIRKRIFQTLGFVPPVFIQIHMIGTLANYRKADILYLLMKGFAHSFPRTQGIPGICEVNRGSLTERVVSRGIGGFELFPPYLKENSMVGPRHESYNPSIYVMPDIRDRSMSIIGDQQTFYLALS